MLGVAPLHALVFGVTGGSQQPSFSRFSRIHLGEKHIRPLLHGLPDLQYHTIAQGIGSASHKTHESLGARGADQHARPIQGTLVPNQFARITLEERDGARDRRVYRFPRIVAEANNRALHVGKKVRYVRFLKGEREEPSLLFDQFLDVLILCEPPHVDLAGAANIST